MSITNIYQNQAPGGLTIVTAVSDLTSSPVYFFWYLDGNYAGMTTSGQKAFLLGPGEAAGVQVLDSTTNTFDPLANQPAAYPATRDVVFYRSLDSSIARYEIQQSKNSGSFATIGYLNDTGAWEYSFLSAALDDLATYQFKVIPLDAAGNAGTAINLGAELIVRTPDAPGFTVTGGGSGLAIALA